MSSTTAERTTKNSLVVSRQICVERVWRTERTKTYLGKENSSRVGGRGRPPLRVT